MSFERWHRVLVHALLGVDLPELGTQPTPDLEGLAALLSGRRAEVQHCRAAESAAGRPWPVPPVGELAEELPWSQYLTALHQLRTRLDLTGIHVEPSRTEPTEDRELRRLRDDRPPHW